MSQELEYESPGDFRDKLHDVMTQGIDPAVLDAMMIGLRQMKTNLSATRRMAEASV